MSDQLTNRLTSWGCVQYVNALPFRLKAIHDRNECFRMVLDTPKNLVDQFLNNELDFVLTSSVCQFMTEAPFIPDLGIAAYQKILSVNLYAKPDFFKLDKSSVIGVIQDSVASTTLIRVLSHFYWKNSLSFERIDPKNIETASHYDGILLIGDSALIHQTLPGYTVYDLAQEWYKFTKLPFVFALFLGKDQIPSYEFRKNLKESLVFSYRNESLLIETARRALPLCSENLLKAYYKLCLYRLGKDEIKGLERFREFYGKLPIY